MRNPSLEVGVFRAWELRHDFEAFMDEIERKRAISGSKTAEFQSCPWRLPLYLDPKLLISVFLPSGVLVAGEFTVYKRGRYDRISAHPAKNLILFSHLEGRGAYANLPR